jgi:hypothetical protein
MNDEFCTRTAGKLRKLGYAPKVAIRYSRFFFHSILFVSGVIVTGMRRRKGVKILMDELPPAFMRTLAGLIALAVTTTGAGIIPAGLAAVDIVPASSRLRSH